MKDIRLRIEQIDAATTQAYRDLASEFQDIILQTGGNARIFSKIWRNFPEGSAWIIPEGENAGAVVTGIAYDTRDGKVYLMKNRERTPKKGQKAADDRRFVELESLPLRLVASLLRCIEGLDFGKASPDIPVCASAGCGKPAPPAADGTMTVPVQDGRKKPSPSGPELVEKPQGKREEPAIEYTGSPITPTEDVFG